MIPLTEAHRPPRFIFSYSKRGSLSTGADDPLCIALHCTAHRARPVHVKMCWVGATTVHRFHYALLCLVADAARIWHLAVEGRGRASDGGMLTVGAHVTWRRCAFGVQVPGGGPRVARTSNVAFPFVLGHKFQRHLHAHARFEP